MNPVDSGSLWGEIIIIMALVLANGLFSMTEMAIVSVRRARLESMAESGNKGAKAALALVKDPSQMFSTIQIGITLIGLLTGMYGGAELTGPVARYMEQIPALAPYAVTLSMGLILTVVTYLSLIFGELVPKQLAISFPEAISTKTAKPMRWFTLLCLPIVQLLTLSTSLVLAMIGVKKREESPVTEEEIKMLLEQGAELGTFEKEEPEMIDRIFKMTDRVAGDIMTPRTQLEWLDIADEEAVIMETLTHTAHFHFPVGRESLDDFVGMVNINDVFAVYYKGQQEKSGLSIHDCILQVVQRPLYVPESMGVMKVVQSLRSEGMHEAVVLDEYGGVSGLLTVHDILEELVGIMPDGEEEIQEEENRIIQRTENSFLIEGLLPIEEFRAYFSIEEKLPHEEEDLYKTLAGFVTFCFGRIPKETECCQWRNFTFEVMDIDNVRIDKILVTVLPVPKQEDSHLV